MKPVVVIGGRINPPTRGHEVLVELAKRIAEETNSTPQLFIIDGEQSGKDKRKNPLSAERRRFYASKFFPQVKIEVVSDAYQILEVLDIQGRTPGKWIAGSDRASKYQKMLDGYGLGGQVLEIDREAGEADGVSATIARQAALEGDWETFKSQMPKGADDALLTDLMEEIRKEMVDASNRTGNSTG